MIGQKELLDKINMLISKSGFPQFALLSGDGGSGRKLIASYIAKQLKGHISMCGIKADDIRFAVDLVNRTTDRIIIIIADADNMSLAAKNALLKVTEEPPQNAYFIVTVEDEYSMPDTLRSRAYLLKMGVYTPEEIHQVAVDYSNHLNPEELDILVNICRTPGEVRTLIDMGVIEFWDYVVKVLDNITAVSVANSFKIAGAIALKPESEGYDLQIFWRAFMMVCSERMKAELTDKAKYAEWIKVTSRHMQMLKVKGANLQMTFDSWIIDIRGVQ